MHFFQINVLPKNAAMPLMSRIGPGKKSPGGKR